MRRQPALAGSRNAAVRQRLQGLGAAGLYGWRADVPPGAYPLGRVIASYVDLDVSFNPPLPDDASRDGKLGPLFARCKVYHCPAFPVEGHQLDYCANSWTENSDDGITLPGGGTVGAAPQPMTKLTSIRRSADVSFLCEGALTLPNDSFGSNDIRDKTCLAYDPTNATDPYNKATCRMLNDDRHGGRTNILYFDGHVAAKPWKDVTRDDFRTYDP